MGGTESSLYPNHGYRILKIATDSPITKTDIQPMLDYICYEPSSENDITFSEIIEKNIEKEMDMVVYNLISQDKRIVKITPSKKWGGPSLLGASIRYEDYSNAHRQVAYVANVYDNSPAK